MNSHTLGKEAQLISIEAGYIEEFERKRQTLMKEATTVFLSNNDIRYLGLVTENQSIFSGKLPPHIKEHAPQNIGNLTKAQMLALKKAYEALPKKEVPGKSQAEPRPIYEKFDKYIDLKNSEYAPLQKLADLFQSQIDKNDGRPIYFKTGPYSAKHVRRENEKNPSNVARSGIEAVKLMCCDHRIHKAILSRLPTDSRDPSLLVHKDDINEDGVVKMSLHVFKDKSHQGLEPLFESRGFLVNTDKHFIHHLSAYQSAELATFNLPRNHWLALAYHRAAIDFLTAHWEFLLTVDMLKTATRLSFSLPIFEIVKSYLGVLSANYDMCIHLDLDKIFFIEMNPPYDFLTDTNRFTIEELERHSTRHYFENDSDELIVRGVARITRYDEECLRHYFRAQVHAREASKPQNDEMTDEQASQMEAAEVNKLMEQLRKKCEARYSQPALKKQATTLTKGALSHTFFGLPQPPVSASATASATASFSFQS